MNNQTQEALKMAIEALQNNQTYDWKGNPLTALDEANEKVINACKEALESQEIGDAEIRQMLNDIEYYQKRVEELEIQKQEYDINEMIDKITPENLQEPVAWIKYEWRVYEGQEYPMTDIQEHDNGGIPLYTHPAQDETSSSQQARLVPLSDDEIEKMAKEMELNEIGFLIYKGMVRAIEQAHGIGVKE
jgi:hypothetical protein